MSQLFDHPGSPENGGEAYENWLTLWKNFFYLYCDVFPKWKKVVSLYKTNQTTLRETCKTNQGFMFGSPVVFKYFLTNKNPIKQ